MNGSRSADLIAGGDIDGLALTAVEDLRRRIAAGERRRDRDPFRHARQIGQEPRRSAWSTQRSNFGRISRDASSVKVSSERRDAAHLRMASRTSAARPLGCRSTLISTLVSTTQRSAFIGEQLVEQLVGQPSPGRFLACRRHGLDKALPGSPRIRW